MIIRLINRLIKISFFYFFIYLLFNNLTCNKVTISNLFYLFFLKIVKLLFKRMSTTASSSSLNGADRKIVQDLDKPQYNSSLKLIKKIEELNLANEKNGKTGLPTEQLEKINEKVTTFIIIK
jgi:hypothetical protein